MITVRMNLKPVTTTGLPTDMENILASGASVIVRPLGCQSFGIGVEHHGLRHGVACSDLSEGFARAYEWVQDVDFYHGMHWTAEQLAILKARAA